MTRMNLTRPRPIFVALLGVALMGLWTWPALLAGLVLVGIAVGVDP